MEYRGLFLITLLLSVSAQIVPATAQGFPYRLNKKDFIIVPLSASAYFGSRSLGKEKYHNLTITEISRLDRADINRFDRNATYYWNRSMDKTSDIVYKGMPIVPALLVIPQLGKKEWRNTATLGVMYLEVFWLTTGITGLSKSVTGRIRPYLYNTSFTPEERFEFQGKEAPQASTSFISGHSSSTFAFAVFVSKTYTDIYGKGVGSVLVWSSALALASLTAYARVAGGEHFPTDVLAGALAGSAIGYFIPVLHKNTPDKLSFSILPGHFSFSYRL